MKDVVGKLT